MPYSSTTSTVFSEAGVARAQYAIMDANGVPQGTSGSLSNGQDSGAGAWIAIKRAGGNIPPPRTVVVSGDNGRFRHKYAFNPAEIGELEMNFGAFDQSIYAKVSGTKVDTGDAEWALIGGETNQRVNAVQTCIIVNTDAQDANSGTNGQARFANYFYPLVNVIPLFATMEEAAGAEFQYRGIRTLASKKPWGTAFSTAVNGFTSATFFQVSSVYPLTMHTFLGDGATSSFYLNYTPASDATGYAIKAWNANTGVAVTLSSVVPGTKRVTLSSAPAAGVPIVVLYEAIDLLV